MASSLLVEDPSFKPTILGFTPSSGVNGRSVSGLVDLPKVETLGLVRSPLRVMVESGPPVKTPGGPRGVIGAGLLRQLILTVDPRAPAAWVQPRPAQAPAGRLEPDLFGCDDLMLAADAGDLADCQALLAAGADVRRVDRKGRSALVYAVNHAEVDVAAALIAKGAAVDAKDASGQTPLGMALDFRMPAMERCLREAGARDSGTHRPRTAGPASAAPAR
jgi:hypothetical protein